MLDKPDLPDERVIACLQAAYGLRVTQVNFLPLGADVHTAVYRAVADDNQAYFVKLRSGAFQETSVALPRWLCAQGLLHLIGPLTTLTDELWARFAEFTLVLYPFVVGRNGYEVALSEQHWHALGTTLQRLHTAEVPPSLAQRIPRESFSAEYRLAVMALLSRRESEAGTDPVARQLIAVLADQHDRIRDLVGRADRLARELQARPRDNVVCHADLHAGNIFIADNGHLYIVDWDDALFAPKERDLMFIGGGQGFRGSTAQEEEALFYAGYGPTAVDPVAQAYYRYERIIQDIAAFSEDILCSTQGGEDRAQALRYLIANFQPGNTLAIADASDTTRWRQING